MDDDEQIFYLEKFRMLTEKNRAEIIAYVVNLLSEPKPLIIAQEVTA